MNHEPYIVPEQLDPLDRWCRIFAITVGAALILFWLTGCASFDYQWQQTRPASAKPWVYVIVADADEVCRATGADPERRLGRINACATWKPEGCIIYLPQNAPQWLEDHENMHCAGLTHK